VPEAPFVVIRCPACGHAATEKMPVAFCLYFYTCPACQLLLRPQPADCCVFCSYGDEKCPTAVRPFIEE
jgi:hypothetical protein